MTRGKFPGWLSMEPDRANLELRPDEARVDERQREIDGYLDRYYATGRWDWEPVVEPRPPYTDEPEPPPPRWPGLVVAFCAGVLALAVVLVVAR